MVFSMSSPHSHASGSSAIHSFLASMLGRTCRPVTMASVSSSTSMILGWSQSARSPSCMVRCQGDRAPVLAGQDDVRVLVQERVERGAERHLVVHGDDGGLGLVLAIAQERLDRLRSLGGTTQVVHH